MDKIVIGSTSSCQNEPESYGNEETLHTPQISRTGTSPSDAGWCQT